MPNSKDSRDVTSNDQSAQAYDNQREASANEAQEESSAPSQREDRVNFSMHDTPPPIIVGDGSVTIETDTDESFKVGAPVGGKQQHQRSPRDGNNRAYFHAIRVLKGNGETLDNFHPINDRDNSQIEIVLDDGTRMLIKGGPLFFIETESNKPLQKSANAKGKKRKHIFKYRDSNNHGRTMRSVTITDGNHVFTINLDPDQLDPDQEFQLWIWVEDVTV